MYGNKLNSQIQKMNIVKSCLFFEFARHFLSMSRSHGAQHSRQPTQTEKSINNRVNKFLTKIIDDSFARDIVFISIILQRDYSIVITPYKIEVKI